MGRFINKKKLDYLSTLPGALLVLALVAIVIVNGIVTKCETERQAMVYLEQVSDRAAEELEKTFLRQLQSMQTMAHMTAHIMEYEYIGTEELIHLTETSSFDGIEYVHASGSCYGMNQQSWSVKEKDYFRDAIQGNIGYAYDEAPERGDEGCLLFYSPIVSDQGDFDGILAGYLCRETVEQMLDISFWGHSSKQYLCTLDGTIIASNDYENVCSNILDMYQKCGYMSEDEQGHLISIFEAKDGNFTYKVGSKTELGTVSAVENGKFLLVETFPPEVLSELMSPMMNTMHLAVAGVMLSLVLYGVVTFIIGRNYKIHLETENGKVRALLRGAEDCANHDGLTGLCNRRGMFDGIKRQNLQEKHFAFIILDIDHFKQINDEFGHQVGDDLLVKVAGLLKETFRSEDILVRMGGDEFAIILPNCKMEQSEVVKQKILRLNETLQHPEDNMPAVSISVGIAFSRPGEKKEVAKRADKALYVIKANGRNGCCVYEEVFDE